MKKTHKLLVISLLLITFTNQAFAQKKYSYTPAKNADQMIQNIQTFYDKIYVHLTRFSELTEYESVTIKLEEEIEKYENTLTPAQKKRFDTLVKKVQKKKDSMIGDDDYHLIEPAVAEESDTFAVITVDDVIYSYGPAHSEEDYLDKIERIYNEMIAPATSLDDLEAYQDDLNLIENERDKFYETFTTQQKKRYADLTTKIQSKENSLRSDLNPSKYAHAKNANEALANLNDFLKTVFLPAKEEAFENVISDHANDLEAISYNISKYMLNFTEKQTKELEDISNIITKKYEDVYFAQAKKNLPASKYGPSDSPDNFLANLELFYKEVLIPLSRKKDVSVPDSYYEYQSVFNFDRNVYIEKFNEKQEERYDALLDKINEKENKTFGYEILSKADIQFAPPIISEDDIDTEAEADSAAVIGYAPSETVDYAKEKICSICSYSAQDLLDNLKTFYDDSFSSFSDLDAALDFVPEMQDMQESINEYESGFTATQKNEFDKIIEKYRQKAEQLGLISYPQSFTHE